MDLEQVAKKVRSLTVRSIKNAGSGHPGGALSMVEIITLLHCEVMRPVYPDYHPDKAQDIFILSGGHKWPSLLSLWSVLGWIPESIPLSLRKLGSIAQGHPSRLHTPWCWTSTGSLGQGLSVAVGYALAFQRQGLDRRVYCLASEGDLNEGVGLESLRIAAHYSLTNFILIVDSNDKMSDQFSKVMVKPERELSGLGFWVRNCKGHDFAELRQSLSLIPQGQYPLAVVAWTIKGYPVPAWTLDPDGGHGSLTLSQEDVEQALEAING